MPEGCCQLYFVSQTTTVLCSCTAFCDFLQEALEMGSAALLLDEDTCASNFMHRDERMRVRSFLCAVPCATHLIHCIGLQGSSAD